MSGPGLSLLRSARSASSLPKNCGVCSQATRSLPISAPARPFIFPPGKIATCCAIIRTGKIREIKGILPLRPSWPWQPGNDSPIDNFFTSPKTDASSPDNKSRFAVMRGDGCRHPGWSSRRPSMPQGFSAGLGLHVGETAKRRQALVEASPVTTRRNKKTIPYGTVRPEGKGIPVTLKGTI